MADTTISDEELATLRSRADAGDSAASRLEQTTADLLTQTERANELAGAGAQAEAATAALLEATRAAHPAIPPELISGDTAADIAASVTAGQSVVDRVAEHAKVPPGPAVTAGTPPRGPDQPPADLTGIQRISWALSHPGPGNTEV